MPSTVVPTVASIVVPMLPMEELPVPPIEVVPGTAGMCSSQGLDARWWGTWIFKGGRVVPFETLFVNERLSVKITRTPGAFVRLFSPGVFALR